MKRTIQTLLIVLTIISCSEDKTLTFEPLTLDETRCSECPEVVIHIPVAVENQEIAKTINTSIKEEIIFILNYDDETDAATIKDAVKNFSDGFWELKKLYPEEATVWEANIEGIVSYEDETYITIELNTYLFTGGAHGYGSKKFLNFDKIKNQELENWELFQNRDDFEVLAEEKFRTQESIPMDKNINSTGFMFDSDSFYLPENIGFTAEGIQLHYNPYEVASYVDGPIEVILPFKEVAPYLAKRTKS
ncbi:DUF3298 and DUF4163 domain-containing protein [Euzebyella saccharophila]|uniref:DUF3298 domain-containing protein n=1 Tax=Euzebyella saccharophila TaxID=679664 RepID=A0ABV8JMC6_9FLAO|nr:DUF3298 and DUF4163 domain-containing protein [Euzebyella saccharophila]